MLKLATLFLLAGSALAAFCPTQIITSITLGGNLPNGVANITAVPQGTNCTFTFNIPNNYNILLKFSAQSSSKNDVVTVYDHNNYPVYTLKMSTTPFYDIPLWLPAKYAAVRVEAASGNMKFMLSYLYQSLANYQQINRKTGEYFSLTDLVNSNYVTITSSSVNEKVIVSPASRAGSDPDVSLSQMYVYDGDNINTANVMGPLSDFTNIRISTGKSVSIVKFSGLTTRSYALGNDASTLNGFGKYIVLLTSKGTSINGNMTDLSGSVNGAAYTWICTDCSTFYWTRLRFDSFSTISNKAYVSFQGQTPTHKREKLIRYDAMTVTDSYFPQMMPSNVLTLNLYLGRTEFYFNNINDDSSWRKPYIGRKGYIFAPNLWTSAANNFNYEFRDDSQLYNFTINFIKTSFPASADKMTLKIGSETGTPAVNNTYPRDLSSSQKVMSNGNYMQVGLSASVASDVRLSFEMQKGNPASAVGILTAFALSIFYAL
ncbi:hypothetical protein L5515_005706 [Caenorhabditis briggsae]|uniref:CUB-like domain-containing protein n=1 Tax=Caenorhabditis briggsae TaxID=6238 RepID=A0AAE9EZF3_CAEBR|nr:hypothetical protein L5515_005706 [Caenorhabditis briggsae]